MLAFRPSLIANDPQSLTPDRIAHICGEVIHRDNFLISPDYRLNWLHCQEEPFWELFLGQALSSSHTRERRQFESWWISMEGGDPEEPLLALRWDRHADVIFVTRAIECRIREGCEIEPGVFDTRIVSRWMRELVGAVDLRSCPTSGRLRDELQGLLFQAVVGTSRLPITSLESPLPAFTLGHLMYSFRSSAPEHPNLNAFQRIESAKRLEFALRSRDNIAALTTELVRTQSDIGEWLSLLLAAFNGASLSPYTEFVPRAVALMRRLTESNLELRADFIARLTLLLDRHLCAFDLVKFHHRGANYPDALLLEELWREWMELVERQPSLFAVDDSEFASTRRRRAVRHALLLRIEYAGHLVPDWPTSIGENARVLPAPFRELPDEQIHAPQRRTRKLFQSESPWNDLVESFFDDLRDPREVRELGTAIYLNRPLGIGKPAGEPDRTPLLSHILVSRTIAERRLTIASRRACLGGITPPAHCTDGLPLTDCGPPPRPGVVSLHDAMLSADDWVALRTTRSSLRDWDAAFDWSESGMQPSRDWQLVLPADEELVSFDEQLRPVARLTIDGSGGYRLRGGIEVPAAGLLVSPAGSSNRVRIRPAWGD